MRDAIPILLLGAGCTIQPPDGTGPDPASAGPTGDVEESGSEASEAGPSSTGAGSTGGTPQSTGADSEDASGAASGGSESGGVPTCDPEARGTIYAERDYETEDPEELFIDPVGYATYIVGDCFEGSNCWQVNPIGTMGNEDHAGWGMASLPRLAEGGSQSMFVGHLLYVSSGMIDVMLNHGVAGKMLDGYQWDLPDGGGETRQTVIWSAWAPGFDEQYADTSAAGLIPRLVKGGAGGNFVRQVSDVQFDLANYSDQWIWFEYEFNAVEGYTAMWVKTEDGVFSGANCEPVMFRSAENPDDWHFLGWDEEPYEYNTDEGWQTPGLLWGYWDDLEGKPLDAEDFVRVDHLVVSDAWIAPPF
jgi:hypothetical protein